MSTYSNALIGEGKSLDTMTVRQSGVVVDSDHVPATIEACVSIGEFPGPDGRDTLMITVQTDTGMEMVWLDFTAAHNLMMTLQTQVNMLAEAMHD